MMEIPFLKTGAATVASIVVILSAGYKADSHYIDTDEVAREISDALEPMSEKIEPLEKFVPEYRQQRIWDMEENVIKSGSEDERRMWVKRLRQLLREYCTSYPDEPECDPEYINQYLQDGD